jgi:hypothetical protein
MEIAALESEAAYLFLVEQKSISLASLEETDLFCNKPAIYYSLSSFQRPTRLSRGEPI